MLCCLTPSVLKTVLLNILSVILVVPGGKVNVVPVTSPGLEVEVTYLGFLHNGVLYCSAYFLDGILP